MESKLIRPRCDACGDRIGVELVIPSEAWERIARGDYQLCALCIDERLHEDGLLVHGQAFFQGRGVRTEVSDQLRRVVMAWRPGPTCVAAGPVGNPANYTRAEG